MYESVPIIKTETDKITFTLWICLHLGYCRVESKIRVIKSLKFLCAKFLKRFYFFSSEIFLMPEAEGKRGKVFAKFDKTDSDFGKVIKTI